MSDYATNVDQISSSQASKEIIVNANFNAASPSLAFGRRDQTTSTLTWGYYGGNFRVAGALTWIPNGTLTLTDNATCYIKVTAAGVVDFTTSAPSGWPDMVTGDVALYEVTTLGGVTTNWLDKRTAQGINGNDGTDGTFGPPGAIVGLLPTWVSTTELGASAGYVHIESLGSTIYAAPSNITPSSPSASTWYHVYITSAGVLEASTTVPVPFATPVGTACSKSGDTSRRFLYSAITDASSHWYQFYCGPDMFWKWQAFTANATPFRVLSNGSATTSTAVSCAGAVPVITRMLFVRLTNTNTSNAGLHVSSGNYTVSTSAFDINVYPLSTSVIAIINGFTGCDASQGLNYLMSTTGGGGYIDVLGYFLQR